MHNEHIARLEALKRAAVPLLFRLGPEAAAEALGIPEAELRRWLRLPSFKRRLKELADEMEASRARLAASCRWRCLAAAVDILAARDSNSARICADLLKLTWSDRPEEPAGELASILGAIAASAGLEGEHEEAGGGSAPMPGASDDSSREGSVGMDGASDPEEVVA